MDVIAQLRAYCRQHKLDTADVLEFWTERAAIMEYSGGLTRDEAERVAHAETLARYAAR